MRAFTRRRFVCGTATAFGAAAVSPLGAGAAGFDYKFAHNLAVDHPLNVRMVECWDEVRKESGGRLNVRVFPNSVLGGDTAVLSQLRSGAVQFFTLDGGILQSVVPVAAIQGIGFAFNDSQQAFRAFDGRLGDYVRKAIGDAGLYVHPKMWENGMRQITSSKGPIRTVADLSDFKIRTPAGALWVDLFKSLGASPAPINFNEVYTALQTRVVDGQENPYAIVNTSRLYEVQKYLSVTNHMWSAYYFLANMKAWTALPADIRRIVESSLTKYALLQRADTARLNAALADVLVRKGMIFNAADATGFRRKLTESGFYEKWKRAFGDEAWTLLEGR
jgi:TRAP-type transport system periplasmic protein